MEWLAIIATLSCGIFCGAAIYINVVEHPARLSCGTEIAATEWRPSYKRATLMQAPLAMVAAAGGVALWMRGAGSVWLWGALLIFAVVPFTLIVIRPTNNRLQRGDLDLRSNEARRLLETWGRLHAVRTAASVAALLLYLRGMTML
jgi:hypothetical protein